MALADEQVLIARAFVKAGKNIEPELSVRFQEKQASFRMTNLGQAAELVRQMKPDIFAFIIVAWTYVISKDRVRGDITKRGDRTEFVTQIVKDRKGGTLFRAWRIDRLKGTFEPMEDSGGSKIPSNLDISW
jgi:hypothetical protein